jgi:hypothetical protein
MAYVRRLMQSRRMMTIVPDQGLIAAGQGDGDSYLVSCRGADFAFVYAGTGQNFTVNLGRFPGTRVNAWWYNPRTGKATWLGSYANSGTRSFDPPGTKARANDWILILDDAAKSYSAPDGTRPGTTAARMDNQPEDQAQAAPEAEATQLFPNPANNQVTFAFTAKKQGPVDVVIHDATGREVKRTRVQAGSGSTEVVIGVEDLAPGFYFIRGGSGVSKKLVIDR